jgi:hypothetical protein
MRHSQFLDTLDILECMSLYHDKEQQRVCISRRGDGYIIVNVCVYIQCKEVMSPLFVGMLIETYVA